MVMQPNNPIPAPPPINPQNMPTGNNPYDFITNPNEQKPSKFKLPSGNSKTQRIIIVIGFLVLVIIVFALVSSFLGRGDKAQKEQLTVVVTKQKELIRISEIGVKKARSNEAKNLAITTQLSLTSEQPELKEALKGLGVKERANSQSKINDDELTKAEQSNNFDAVFLEMLKADLTDYAKTLQTAYQGTESKNTKTALESQFNNAATLAGLNNQN